MLPSFAKPRGISLAFRRATLPVHSLGRDKVLNPFSATHPTFEHYRSAVENLGLVIILRVVSDCKLPEVYARTRLRPRGICVFIYKT